MTKIDVVGVGVDALNLPEAALTVLDRANSRRSGYVCVTGVHGIMESWRDPAIRRIHNDAALVVPDGMPLVWLAWLKRMREAGRVYGPDLLLEVCRRSSGQPVRHFFYGGAAGVADQLVARLSDRFPGLTVVGAEAPPPWNAADGIDQRGVDLINKSGADIVWVGLGTPKQERWMAMHSGQVNAPVLIGVGAAFDFLAGLKPQAPHWMQKSGLEWSFRLATEPRRLWRRYLINNPLFLTLIAAQLLGFPRIGPR